MAAQNTLLGTAPRAPSSRGGIGGETYRWRGWRGGRRSRSAWRSPAGAGTSRAGGRRGRPGPARCTVLRRGCGGSGVRPGRTQGHAPPRCPPSPVPLTLLAVAGGAVRGRAGALPLAPHRQLLAGQARLLLQLALRGGSGTLAEGGGHRVPLPAVRYHHPYRRAVSVAVGAADGGERGGVAGLAAPVPLGAWWLDPARDERYGGGTTGRDGAEPLAWFSPSSSPPARSRPRHPPTCAPASCG